MCLGHESSGIVVQLGQNVAAAASTADKRAEELTKLCGDRAKAQNVVGNSALHLGDRVTLEPGTTCRMCTDCRSGRYQVSTWTGSVSVLGLRGTDTEVGLRAYGIRRVPAIRRYPPAILQAVSPSYLELGLKLTQQPC